MFQKSVIGFGLFLLLSSATYALKIPADKTQKVDEVYTKVWEKIYGGLEDDVAQGIVALENGESAIVGTCKSFDAQESDICVSRMGADGQMLWTILLGGEKEDEGRAISRAADGNLFVLGRTKSFSQNYDRDIYVAKISLEGKLLWQKAMGGSRDENPGGIVGTDDGGVIFAGDTESFGKRYRDIYYGKLTQEGKIVFARTIGGKKTDEAHGLTRLKDGTIALVGMRDVNRVNYEDFFIMKMNQQGKILWTKTFGDYDDDSLEGVSATMDGGLVAVGKTRSYGSEQTDLTVMKLNANGKVIWHKIYGFKYYEYGNAVTMTQDGGFMLAGGTSTLGKGSHSVYMLALDKNGALLWSHVYGERNRDIAYGIARMSDGSVVTVGESDSFSRAKDFYMIKVKKK